jgi:hypothetical protein
MLLIAGIFGLLEYRSNPVRLQEFFFAAVMFPLNEIGRLDDSQKVGAAPVMELRTHRLSAQKYSRRVLRPINLKAART